jgi:glucosamine--fructose-6-phosphate aminotransferase (isomerizing)
VSRYLDEIKNLPNALDDLIEYYQRDVGKEKLARWASLMHGRHEVLFSGMGTSALAPISIRARLVARGIEVRTIESGEWLHYGDAFPGQQGSVVLISQSGESAEARGIVEKGIAGAGYVAITNNEKSVVGIRSSLCLPLCAGAEASISTKTYANTLAVLHLVASTLESPDSLAIACGELSQARNGMQIADMRVIEEAADFLRGARYMAYVGRGPSYLCATQSALTFAEGVRIVGAAFTGGGFRHGPMEAVGPDLGMVVFLAEGRTKTLMETLVRECAEAGARVVCITDAAIIPDKNLRVIAVKNCATGNSEHLFPMFAAPVHMLLIHHLAALMGFEAGQFRICEKVTRLE